MWDVVAVLYHELKDWAFIFGPILFTWWLTERQKSGPRGNGKDRTSK